MLELVQFAESLQTTGPIQHDQEESGLIAKDLSPRGCLLYYSEDALIREGGNHAVRIWLYSCETWASEPAEYVSPYIQ